MRILLPLLPLIIVACAQNSDGSKETWKKEIVAAERAFADLAAKEGMHKAFVAFAADDAVLNRSNTLVMGKDSIDAFYLGKNSTGLNWVPEFVDVAESGELGYTYGYYTFSYSDEMGNPVESRGVFHTVWKRQADGSWKFVWD